MPQRIQVVRATKEVPTNCDFFGNSVTFKNKNKH